jgi:hypothetical protein
VTTQHRNPRPPFIDDHSSTIIANADIALSETRGGEDAGDIIGEIQVLASLRLQLDEHIHCIVSEAHNDGCSWHDIAAALGETTAQARRRYNTRPSTSSTTR